MLWLWYAAKLRLKSTQWEGWCKTSFLSWRGDYKDRVQIKRKINQTPNSLSVFTRKGRKVICKNIKTVWKESQCSSLICCTFAAHTAVWPVEGWGDHTDSRAASIGFYPSHQWPGGVVELILQDIYSVESFLHFFFFFLPWIQPACKATGSFHCELWGRSSRPRTALFDQELEKRRVGKADKRKTWEERAQGWSILWYYSWCFHRFIIVHQTCLCSQWNPDYAKQVKLKFHQWLRDNRLYSVYFGAFWEISAPIYDRRHDLVVQYCAKIFIFC